MFLEPKAFVARIDSFSVYEAAVDGVATGFHGQRPDSPEARMSIQNVPFMGFGMCSI